MPDISWYSTVLSKYDWSKKGKSLACLIDGSRLETGAKQDDNDLYLIFNASRKSLTFSLPALPAGKQWWRSIDTSMASPQDIVPDGGEIIVVPDEGYIMAPHSMVVL